MSGDAPESSSLRRNLAARRVPGLDGLRAIAIFLVIFYHAGVFYSAAAHGVMLFFVLSGFLITRLLILEENEAGSVSLRSFYARRTLRIFPAFYAYAALVLMLLLIARRPVIWPQVWASLFYLNNYYQAVWGDPQTAFSHTWSLAIEEQFYLLWPGLFILFGTTRNRLRGCCIMIAAVWIQRAVRVFVFHTPDGYLYEAFDTRVDSLLAGCGIALILAMPGGLQWIERVICSRWKMIVVIALLTLSITLQFQLALWFRQVIGFSLDPLLMAALVICVVAFVFDPVVRVLEWPAVRYLGRISYGLYLYQQIAIGILEKRLGRVPFPLTITVASACCVLAASASFFLIERPALLLGRRYQRIPENRAL